MVWHKLLRVGYNICHSQEFQYANVGAGLNPLKRLEYASARRCANMNIIGTSLAISV
jgi:hypothetical protein